jgi:uncharacterized protein
MIRWEEHAEGAILTVRAYAGARRNGITGEHDGMLKVSVTQAPEKGKANQAIMEVLCNSFDLKKNQIELLFGQTSSQKQFLIRRLTLQEQRAIAVIIQSSLQ